MYFNQYYRKLRNAPIFFVIIPQNQKKIVKLRWIVNQKPAKRDHTWVWPRGGKKGISLCLVTISCSGLESKKKTKVRIVSSLSQIFRAIHIYPRNTKRSKTKKRNGEYFWCRNCQISWANQCFFMPFLSLYISFIDNVFLEPSLNWHRILSHQTATISYFKAP